MGSGAFGKLMLGKSEGKEPSERHKRKWEENYGIVVKGIGCGNGDRIDLA
jgi:hypothetical protein